MKSLLLCIFCFVSSFCFSQQTEEFRLIKNYYNQHRTMLGNEFKKKFDAQTDSYHKASVKLDYMLFMQKMDSIENVAMIGALLKVKNLEDLSKLRISRDNSTSESFISAKSSVKEKSADYPGGFDGLRKEIADVFYIAGVNSSLKTVKTNVAFFVEKDGSITNVEARGDNFTFNRQAEIAVYSVSQKFSPTIINGDPVRYQYHLPLTMNVE